MFTRFLLRGTIIRTFLLRLLLMCILPAKISANVVVVLLVFAVCRLRATSFSPEEATHVTIESMKELEIFSRVRDSHLPLRDYGYEWKIQRENLDVGLDGASCRITSKSFRSH